jgi:hypothetical protein
MRSPARPDQFSAAFVEAVRGLPAATAQQKLSATADRDLSIALLGVEGADRDFILSFVSAEKRHRVLLEIERVRRARLGPRERSLVLGRVIQHIRSTGSQTFKGSWFRPRKK